MAGEWIKMRTNLWNDPRVSRLCDLTGCDEAAVIGGLYWLWATGDDHSADGILPGLTLAAIARKTGIPNLGAALAQIGWVDELESGIRILKFDDHNGSSAKKRAETARRVADHRAKHREDGPGGLTSERTALPKAVVKDVIDRDQHRCVYCGRPEGHVDPTEMKPDGILHIDHVIPVSRNGSDDPLNLVSACRKCNMAKGDRTPDECGYVWPVIDGRRAGNTKNVTGALAREEKEKNKKDSGTSNAVTPNAKIALGDNGAWTGIPDALMATWKQAYPALSLDAELSKAAAWIIANPANKKSNYARFLTNWLSRAQDNAPRVASGQAAQQPRNGRFDAVAFVNRNRPTENHERTDDIIDV